MSLLRYTREIRKEWSGDDGPARGDINALSDVVNKLDKLCIFLRSESNSKKVSNYVAHEADLVHLECRNIFKRRNDERQKEYDRDINTGDLV